MVPKRAGKESFCTDHEIPFCATIVHAFFIAGKFQPAMAMLIKCKIG